jgi:hypothetical protein
VLLCCPLPTGGAKLLNPLYVAQRRLQEASNLLAQGIQPEDVTAALQLVKSSSLKCYKFEALPDDTIKTRASLLTQKYELSVSSSSASQTLPQQRADAATAAVPPAVAGCSG